MNSKNRRNYNVFFNTHTVSGIVISLGLFVCFFAGAFALFMDNINNWESNSKPIHQSYKVDYERALQVIENEGYEMNGRNFSLGLRKDKNPYLQISSEAIIIDSSNVDTACIDSMAYSNFFYKLDPFDYTVLSTKFENHSEQLGTFLYDLHHYNQIPVVGLYLSGFVSLFFLFAIITGIIIHWKKIVSNFFTFRLKSNIKIMWTDAHTALGIIGLPFQFMYAVSGTIYGLVIVLFIPTTMILFDGNQQEMISYIAPGFSGSDPSGEISYERANINSLVDQVKSKYTSKKIESTFLSITNFNDENAELTISLDIDGGKSFFSNAYSTYRLMNGELIIEKSLGDNSYTDSVILTIHKLHFADYGGYFIKAIYFLLALITCAVILSGVLIWLEARYKSKYYQRHKFNRNVGAIYIGASMGLFPSIALMFCLTKIIPLDQQDRFSSISTMFFMFWLGYILYSYWLKDIYKINKNALILAGLFGMVIPILNGLQSNLWMWNSLTKGYRDSFFIDASWFTIGVASIVSASKVRRFDRKDVFKNAIKKEQAKGRNSNNLKTIYKSNTNTMNYTLKTTLLWFTIAICLLMHAALETSSSLYFHALPDTPEVEGIPTDVHVIYLVAMILPLIFGVLTMYFKSNIFKIISLIYASILVILNTFHVIEESSLENPTQLVLLGFVPIVCVLLILQLWKWRKEEIEHT